MAERSVSLMALLGIAGFVASVWQMPLNSAFAQSGAHGEGHAENHDWYRQLKQPGTGYSCCNGDSVDADGNPREGDCRPVRAWPDANGDWTAIIDDKPVPVPPRVVLKEQAPDGRSHICASKSGLIYCFLGGSPKS